MHVLKDGRVVKKGYTVNLEMGGGFRRRGGVGFFPRWMCLGRVWMLRRRQKRWRAGEEEAEEDGHDDNEGGNWMLDAVAPHPGLQASLPPRIAPRLPSSMCLLKHVSGRRVESHAGVDTASYPCCLSTAGSPPLQLEIEYENERK